MLNTTIICYFISLLFYGMGISRILVIKSAVTEHTFNYTINVTLATSYFVLAIFFTLIGSLYYYYKNNFEQEIVEINDKEFRVSASTELNDRRRVSIFEVKDQLAQSQYALDRRMSS